MSHLQNSNTPKIKCENYETIYFKFLFDDSQTIDDILVNIDHLKIKFLKLKADGFELIQPVDSGYCFISKPKFFKF